MHVCFFLEIINWTLLSKLAQERLNVGKDLIKHTAGLCLMTKCHIPISFARYIHSHKENLLKLLRKSQQDEQWIEKVGAGIDESQRIIGEFNQYKSRLKLL